MKDEALLSTQEIAAPVQFEQRIDVIDVLRGFALLGILIVNMRDYNSLTEYFSPAQLWTSTIDQITEWWIAAFVNEKFYSLFSFLFGLGFAVQMMRLGKKRNDFIKIYLRRLFVLFVFGVLHGIVIWWGDVLAVYALFGAALLLLRRLSQKVILLIALSVLLIPVAYSTVKLTLTFSETGDQTTLSAILFPQELRAEEKAMVMTMNKTYSTGSYYDIMQHRLNVLADTYRSWLYRSYGAQVFGMFLLGMYAGKKRFFHEIEAHLPFIKKIWRYGALLCLFYAALFFALKISGDNPPFAFNLGVFEFGKVMRIVFVLFYSATIILLFRQMVWKKVLSLFAPAGRMALTNYMMQSVVCTMLFYSYGAGLYGTIAPFESLLLAVTLFTLQLAASSWWLKRFRFGPLEWLWRSLTYAQRQPLRMQNR